jgi:hypothetical protein
MWKKLIVWLFGCISIFAMRYIYGPWSRFYRRVFEKKYTAMPAGLPWNSKKVMDFFRKCTWTKDKWYMGWDVMSKPERLFETHRGDCDEFATFAADTMSGGKRWILSVTWYNPTKGQKTFAGHNVCIYPRIKMVHDEKLGRKRPIMRWWHISNWGKIGPFKTIYETVDSIPPEGAIGCAWSLRLARGRKGYKDLQFRFGGRFKHQKK